MQGGARPPRGARRRCRSIHRRSSDPCRRADGACQPPTVPHPTTRDRGRVQLLRSSCDALTSMTPEARSHEFRRIEILGERFVQDSRVDAIGHRSRQVGRPRGRRPFGSAWIVVPPAASCSSGHEADDVRQSAVGHRLGHADRLGQRGMMPAYRKSTPASANGPACHEWKARASGGKDVCRPVRVPLHPIDRRRRRPPGSAPGSSATARRCRGSWTRVARCGDAFAVGATRRCGHQERKAVTGDPCVLTPSS